MKQLLSAMAEHVKESVERIEREGFPNATAQDYQLPFHLQNWPEWLANLSPIRTEGLKLSPEESQALIDAFGDGGDQKVLDGLAGKIHAVGMTEFFVRLGSRSPKDSYGRIDGLKQTTGKMAVCVLAQSERVYVDLRSYQTAGLQPWLFLREWRNDISELNEFRCYVINGELMGVSQYQYHTDENAVVPIEECRSAVCNFWEAIREQWLRDMGDGVFDLWIADGKAHLLEVNPPMVSDPCLFRNGFAREVRYVNEKISL